MNNSENWQPLTARGCPIHTELSDIKQHIEQLEQVIEQEREGAIVSARFVKDKTKRENFIKMKNWRLAKIAQAIKPLRKRAAELTGEHRAERETFKGYSSAREVHFFLGREAARKWTIERAKKQHNF